jgi:hypothetical protein
MLITEFYLSDSQILVKKLVSVWKSLYILSGSHLIKPFSDFDTAISLTPL